MFFVFLMLVTAAAGPGNVNFEIFKTKLRAEIKKEVRQKLRTINKADGDMLTNKQIAAEVDKFMKNKVLIESV